MSTPNIENVSWQMKREEGAYVLPVSDRTEDIGTGVVSWLSMDGVARETKRVDWPDEKREPPPQDSENGDP